MSLIIRLELAAPGQQILHSNNQVFNVIVAGHAIAMSAPSNLLVGSSFLIISS